MKHLKELYNKSFTTTKKTYVNFDAIKELVANRLQPEFFNQTNDVKVEIKETDHEYEVIATCDELVTYHRVNLQEDTTQEQIEEVKKEVTDIYINHFKNAQVSDEHLTTCKAFKVIVKDFKSTQTISKDKNNSVRENTKIDFKSNGKYVTDNDVHGEVTKKDLTYNEDGTIKGFKILTYDNHIVEYVFN